VRQQPRVCVERCVVDQRAFREPVVARFVVLEAGCRDVIAQREQEVVGPIVVGIEQGDPLCDELAQRDLGLGPDLERGFAVGREMKPVLGGSAAGQVDLPIVGAARDGRVDQLGERDRLELHAIAAARPYAQRAAVFPSGGQRQRRLVDEIVDRDARGIQEQRVPAHHCGLIRGHRPVAVHGRARRRQVIELDLELVRTRRDIDVEREGIAGVAIPGNRLAIGSDHEPGQLRDRSGRPVLAGQILRIEQRQRSGLDGHRESCVQDALGGAAHVDVDFDGLRGLRGRCRAARDSEAEGREQKTEQRESADGVQAARERHGDPPGCASGGG